MVCSSFPVSGFAAHCSTSMASGLTGWGDKGSAVSQLDEVRLKLSFAKVRLAEVFTVRRVNCVMSVYLRLKSPSLAAFCASGSFFAWRTTKSNLTRFARHRSRWAKAVTVMGVFIPRGETQKCRSDASSFVGLVAAGASAAAMGGSLHGSLSKVLEQARGHIDFARLSHFAPISPDVHDIQNMAFS